MHLRKLLLALLFAGILPTASAMSLGEGQILSHVGEPFAANIALIGSYSNEVKFAQVRNAECRSSITGANGCDSLYEGRLTFSVKRRTDGQYFLKVTGEKGDELFYRLLIKSVSASGGTVFNSFEFLPEFKANPDEQPAVANDLDVVLPAGKYGIVGGKIIEVAPDEEGGPSAKGAAVPLAPVKAKMPDEPRQKRSAQPVDAPVKKPLETRLQIKKYGEYADDIHALQKENGEIEEQIVLLEKHIGLLKEVIRLKSQVGASMVPETGVLAAAPTRAPVRVPLPVPSQLPQANDEPGMLTWVLLAVVLALSSLLGWMFLKIRRLSLNGNSVGRGTTIFSPTSLNERKSLDLTGAFIKPKW